MHRSGCGEGIGQTLTPIACVHDPRVVIIDAEYLAHQSDLNGGRGDSWRATKGWVQLCDEGVGTKFIRLYGYAQLELLTTSKAVETRHD